MKIEKRLDSHSVFRKAVLRQSPWSASLDDTPRTKSEEEKSEDPFPPEQRIHKKGKGNTYAETTRSQTPKVAGDW